MINWTPTVSQPYFEASADSPQYPLYLTLQGIDQADSCIFELYFVCCAVRQWTALSRIDQ